ncbi:xylose isomerase-like TIM barrel protein [Diaminobutyricimonas aerilata]|uniref:Xylose isomerase-like TIM barrel protein n=1 Tax=Diaminobutyricimonas aerilata TaxID=1162967 RepID=A0A2M9CFU0_9MICO|nr:sugar phosphate isomerase/epimerase family protein [Diaminobutyricimonas aerilata]PJJ70749.1 xylose isomerase-like TIM barrel protein [Diaminobutyricimonas aerilata]
MRSIGVIVSSDRIEAAQAAGADYVEPTIVNNLVARSTDGVWGPNPDRETPTGCPSFAILFPGDLRLADPSFSADEVTAYLEAVLPVVAAHAAPGAKIVFGSGAARTIPEGVDRAEAETRFADVVRQARDIAARHDLRIVLEPLHRGETNLINSIAECAAFLDEHGIDGVPIVADLFHIMLEHEPLSVVREQGARIGHVHIADAERRTPGSGDWPLSEFLRALDEGGYTGSVSLECNWDDFPSEVASGLAHVRTLV